MKQRYRYFRMRLSEMGWLPLSKLALTTGYLLGLDLFLFALQKLFSALKLSYGNSLGGWISVLSFGVICLLAALAIRWARAKILWRLRNRLIVTYVFIGVVPVALLIAMAFITIYLFAGQFANFVVISDLSVRMHGLSEVNAAIANELADRIGRGDTSTPESLGGLRRRDRFWAHRETYAWKGGKPWLTSAGTPTPAFAFAPFLGDHFEAIVSDRGKVYVRTATTLRVGPDDLTVVSSEPLDRILLTAIAGDLGEVTLYQPPSSPVQHGAASGKSSAPLDRKDKISINFRPRDAEVRDGTAALWPTLTVGSLPPPSGSIDSIIKFGTPLRVVEWSSGEENKVGALLRVQTRPSVLYTRLFAALGDFAKGVEYVLFAAAIIFAIIELVALLVGARLTRSVTGAIAQLYDATKHINRGDLRHRIPVHSTDQLATLANSFNSMSASLEELIEEQKQKQRLENELVIAQEVQAQLFPREISQLPSLEVHGFCRPARTVSGDYYDFLPLNADRLLIAVGDISGKGISAALLMATIHSAVRAYTINSNVRETVAVGARSRPGGLSDFSTPPGDISPATLLALLNHQLYESTPLEKYATLFVSLYDAELGNLIYSNGGHLPPIILGAEGSVRRLDRGGTVIGLFDHQGYDEASVHLRQGEVFVAYSDGVTEPENDFGEFGEERLIELVQENRDLPLTRITEVITAAVDDWIGAREQPDDITLVLARPR